MSNSKQIVIAIKSIERNNMGEAVIVPAQPIKTANGIVNAIKLHPVQERRLLNRVGIGHIATLKALVALDNGATKATITLTDNKAGEAWDNGKKPGEVGYNGGTFEKDWTRTDVNEIKLGMVGQLKIADAMLAQEAQHMFAGNSFQSAAPKQIETPVESKGEPTPAVEEDPKV